MRLIGMLDSPYVRRVAVSLNLLGVPFEHRAISVFRHFPTFEAINPVVKAPTLVCDNGVTLMDSTLILDYVEAQCGRSLMPAALDERQRALRIIGLALAACEKTVQIVYEIQLRPAEKQHAPWLERVRGQLSAACKALEAECDGKAFADPSAPVTQAEVTTAVAWQFTRAMVPDAADETAYPKLAALSAAAERHPAFRACPP